VTFLNWQAIIVASLVLARAFGGKAVVMVAVGWSLWTLFAVSKPTLLSLQLVVTWGVAWVLTYHVFVHRKKATLQRDLRREQNNARDSKLATEEARHKLTLLQKELAAAGVSQEILKSARLTSDVPFKMIRGKEHRDELHTALRECQPWLCISSGWLGSAALDTEFLDHVSAALESGTSVYLSFGWESSDRTHTPSKRTLEALSALKSRARKQFRRNHAAGTLVIARYATHEKLVVGPDRLIAGSYNWLSNSELRNEERSIMIKDTSIAASEGARLRTLAANNALDLRANALQPSQVALFGACECGVPVVAPRWSGHWDGDFEDDESSGGDMYDADCPNCSRELRCSFAGSWTWRGVSNGGQ
jgi:hypothetical protein